MFHHKSPLPIKFLLGLLAGLIPLTALPAQTPKVTAVLSNSDVEVGQTVQLEIRVTGGSQASIPGEIAVDGLEIHPTGQSTQYEMRNFDVSQSVTYNYTILPLKSGSFKIPSQTVRVGTTSLQTPELKLNVSGAPSGGAAAQSRANPNNGPAQTNSGKVAFAELIVPKTSAYVGEMVPVVVRLGFYSRARGRLTDGPEITGQGFTMQKLQQSEQPRLETINGKTFEILTFKTAIAAARPGKFSIGPVQASAVVALPRRQSGSRPRSPLDIFNMDDPFADPFFSDPFGAFGQQERISIKSDAAPVEIKPLPANAPPTFTGAVGNFTMAVEANPKNVQVGDPITVSATVSGRGNFDRVTAPVLQDEQGWHKYPPSSKFKQDDDVGISGSKTFETVLSPNERKQALPAFAFSYFDPLKEKYVTLNSDAIPIHVEGGSIAAATPSGNATRAPVPTPAAGATPTTLAKPADILYQLTDRPSRAESFDPLYRRKIFWLAQIIPFLALLGLIAWKIRQARRQNKEALKIAALQNEAAELMRKLYRDNSGPREYYANASRAVQIKTALATHSDPNAIDADKAARTFRLDDRTQATLRQLFERNDELQYSGSANGGDAVPAEQRRAVADLIDHLRA